MAIEPWQQQALDHLKAIRAQAESDLELFAAPDTQIHRQARDGGLYDARPALIASLERQIKNLDDVIGKIEKELGV